MKGVLFSIEDTGKRYHSLQKVCERGTFSVKNGISKGKGLDLGVGGEVGLKWNCWLLSYRDCGF